MLCSRLSHVAIDSLDGCRWVVGRYVTLVPASTLSCCCRATHAALSWARRIPHLHNKRRPLETPFSMTVPAHAAPLLVTVEKTKTDNRCFLRQNVRTSLVSLVWSGVDHHLDQHQGMTHNTKHHLPKRKKNHFADRRKRTDRHQSKREHTGILPLPSPSSASSPRWRQPPLPVAATNPTGGSTFSHVLHEEHPISTNYGRDRRDTGLSKKPT